MKATNLINREAVAGTGAAAVFSALLLIHPSAAVAFLGLISGIAALSVLRYQRTTFGLAAGAVGLAAFNSLRVGFGATVSDAMFVAALVMIIGGLLNSRRSLARLPGWLWVSAGLFALASILVELFPAAPSQAALYFPGGIYSRTVSTAQTTRTSERSSAWRWRCCWFRS